MSTNESILRKRGSISPKVADSSIITNKQPDNPAQETIDETWGCKHYGWCLPLNSGNDRHSYSQKLHLNITKEEKNDDNDDSNDNNVQFKPWSHYKNKSKFQEMYTDLRLGNRRWWKSKRNSFFHDYIQVIIQYLILILLSPLALIVIIIVYGGIVIDWIQPFITSLFYTYSAVDGASETNLFDKKHGVKLSSKASTIQVTRFTVYRLFHYAYWVTFDLFLTLSRLISGRQNTSLIKDNELIVYMHSNQHLKFEYDSDGNNIIGGYIDNSDVIDIAEKNLYKGRHFPISRIHYNYKTHIISFTLNDRNKTVLSNDKISCSDSIWDLTKANYISQRCIMDTLTHSWVHFHFADIVSSQLYKYFGNTPHTVLGRLIHSHFIYTSSVNMAGAGDKFNQPQISGDLDGCINTLNPVKINPMKIDGALSILKMRIIKHYYDESGATKDPELMSPRDADIDGIGHKALNIHQFPPKQVRDRLRFFNDESHINKYKGYSLYWDMLSEYYQELYTFISKLIDDKLIDMDELNGFIDIIDKNGMNGLKKCDPTHVLCTLIWTNGYIHGADHTTYHNIMCNFPHLGVYQKFEVGHDDETKDEEKSIHIDPHDDKHNHWKQYYRSWFASWISFKSQIFIHTFTQPLPSCFKQIADYTSSPKLYNNFKNIPSLKSSPKLLESINKYHDEYLKDINRVSDRYEWMINVNELDASISY